jgi:copper chaperone
MKTQDLTIQGMSCGHCVMHVKKALSNIKGVQTESVEIGKARITFDETTVTTAVIAKAIAEAGYQLVS